MAQSASRHYPNAFANSAAFSQPGTHHNNSPSFPSPSPGVGAVGPGSAASGTDGRAAAAAAVPGTPVAGPGYPLPAASANSSNAYFYAGPTPPAQAPSLAPPPVASLSNQLPPSPQQAFPGAHAAPYHGGGASVGSMGPAMMPTGAFPSGPYDQSTAAQAFPHQLQSQDYQQSQSQPLPHSSHSVSPQPRPSPNAGLHRAQQQQQQQQQHTPPTKHPMAAPPLPNSPANAGQFGSATSNTSNAASAPSPSSPQSPGAQSLEPQRVKLLLEINVELLQEVNRLQSSGHGGALSPQQSVQLRNEGKSDSMASDEYIQCLRRVQANLAYLMPRASTSDQSKAPLGPAHMTPPPHMPLLQAQYDRLREFFPNWQGLDARMASSNSSPRTSIGAASSRSNGP